MLKFSNTKLFIIILNKAVSESQEEIDKEVNQIIKYFEDSGVSAYKVSQETSITEAGIGKIINGKSKRPRKNNRKELLNYFSNQYNLETKENYVKEDAVSLTKTQTHKVPVYEIDVTSSIISSFNDVKEIPSFYMDYEPFNDCDAVVTNWGDSMYPAYKNGERLAVKRYNNLEAITWGETFLVITDAEANDLKTVKRVYQHDTDPDVVILRASNPQFKGDTIIHKQNILALYAVKGKISQNFI